jgi:hypothetical protein
MRQGDGTDLLGPNDPRSATIGVVYVTPNDDRQAVLTAILTQDKLGRKQVAVVLPEQNKAFQRPVDFDGLKNMRRGLKAQIVFVAPSGPGPAEFARQRRFPVYSSLESYAQSFKLAVPVGEPAHGSAQRGLFGFVRKKETAAVAVAAAANGISKEESASPLPSNGSVDIPQHEPVSPKEAGENQGTTDERNGSNGGKVAFAGIASLAASIGLSRRANDHNANSSIEKSETNSNTQPPAQSMSQVNGNTSSNGGPVQNGVDAGPEIITFSTSTPRPKITRQFPVPPAEAAPIPITTTASNAQTNGNGAVTSTNNSNTGKRAAVVTGAGVGTAMATPATQGGGPPPGGGSPVGPGGGGVGGSRRRRQILAILLVILTLLLIGGIAAAAIPGGLGSISHVIPGVSTTAVVTITPKSQTVSNTYAIFAVTGTPDPAKREVAARILTATSPTQSKTVQSSGSIPGTRATGTLNFLNTSNSTKSFGSVILRGASGVPVTFNGPVIVSAIPGSLTITGFAVSAGSAGNIGAFDISESCCASGITVKNGTFSGGQNAQPNSVVLQGDINGAADALTASLTPATQADLQKQVKSNEQVVPGTQKCAKSTFTANHVAGDHAPNVTVTVAITCKEEVYDQQAALTMAESLLKAQASKDPGPAYALTGSIVTNVTKASVVDTKGTVSLLVSAQGVWVYQFSDAVKQDMKNHIATKSQQDATKYLLSQPGVSDVKIVISSGTTLPDAAHITIEIVAIPGATSSPTPGTGTPPGSPTVVPTGPTPTPTQGLGG